MTIRKVITNNKKQIIFLQQNHFHLFARLVSSATVGRTNCSQRNLHRLRPISSSSTLRSFCKDRNMPPTEHNEPDIWDSSTSGKVRTIANTSPAEVTEESIWIFGYGSLIWKTNFPYSRKLTGYINGFMRRFWQGSTDHRGVPGQPGRVVTLIPKEEEITWGVAYQVLPASVPEVMAYLNHREKGGYSLHSVDFHPKDEKLLRFQVYVYIATEDNEEYLGDAPLSEIARQIATSKGPSGNNSEYLLELANAVKDMGVHDDHLFDLEKNVKEELINNLFARALKPNENIEASLASMSKTLVLADKEVDRQD